LAQSLKISFHDKERQRARCARPSRINPNDFKKRRERNPEGVLIFS